MKDTKWFEEESEKMFDDLIDIADYIAYNNSDFICTTCLTTLEKLKAYVHIHFGFEKYIYFTEVIDSMLEENEYED